MKAVLVTFTTTASFEDLVEPFTAYAQAMTDLPGLISKTWIANGSAVGGFHIFIDQASADRYFQGEMYSSVVANPAFSNFTMQQFEVLEELSAITGSPQVPAFQAQG